MEIKVVLDLSPGQLAWLEEQCLNRSQSMTDQVQWMITALINKESSSKHHSIPLRGGRYYYVTILEKEVWAASHPLLDIDQQLDNIVEWNYYNPKRRKTIVGIRRHIQTWLHKASRWQEKQNEKGTKTPIDDWIAMGSYKTKKPPEEPPVGGGQYVEDLTPKDEP